MSGAKTRFVTGLTGLVVEPHPHERLRMTYKRTLRVLSNMPADSGYRVNTEAIIRNRLDLVNTTKNIAQLEQKIHSGCIEEVIRQSERELYLARQMLNYKPWEPLINLPPQSQFQWPPV